MKSKKQLIVNLNYFDTVLDKWKNKEPLEKKEVKYLQIVLLCLINAYFGLTILISSIISYFVIRKVGLLTKCMNCGSINSFSPVKKYMKK